VAPLRGAGVEIDGHRIATVLVGIALVTLAVLVVVFTIVGIDKNRQIDQLRDHGVAVNVVITGCQGLLGGSGSNQAGYACRGTYAMAGDRYNESLPGTALRVPGTVIRAVAVPRDPALVSPVSIVDSEHASAKVFILPAALLVILVAAVVLLVLCRRRSRPQEGGV
jgi:heme A synthase